MLLLSLGALAVDPDRGWAAAVSSDLIGGGATRRQLAVTMLIPVTGAVLLKITDAAVIGPSLAMALLVILTTAT